MPNRKAKDRKALRIKTDKELTKNGRTPGQIKRAKRKAARKINF